MLKIENLNKYLVKSMQIQKFNFQNDFEPSFKAHHPVHLQERATEEFHLWEVGAIKLVPLVTADPENLQLQSYYSISYWRDDHT